MKSAMKYMKLPFRCICQFQLRICIRRTTPGTSVSEMSALDRLRLLPSDGIISERARHYLADVITNPGLSSARAEL